MNKVHVDHELLKSALQATDNYLGVLKSSRTEGTEQHIHDFTQHYTNAHAALKALNAINDHEHYMKQHVGEMIRNAKDEDLTLADEPYAHAPKGAGEADESVEKDGTMLDESSEAALRSKAEKSGVSLGTLRKVFQRGVAAWRTSHRPGTTPTQWGLARVNSYIMKGKTYHTADKDLREDLFDNDFNNEELNHIVKNLEWEDIVEFYNDNELELEENTIETIDEKISAMSRIQRSMRFARSASRREVAKAIKLRRASDVKTLQNRAHKAARRALMNRFLRGRDKSQLSAQEKDQIEAQVNRMSAVQANLAMKMLPKIRQLEKQRLAKR